MSEWQEIKLGELIDINQSSIGRNYEFENIRYYDISSIGTGAAEDPKNLSILEAPSRAKRIIKDGDTILATVRPGNRSFYYFKQARENDIASTGFAVISPKNNLIDNKFLYYLISAQSFTNYLVSNEQGATYSAITPSVINRAKINLPPLPIQQKIAKILSNYDDLIENNLKRIKLLEESARLTYEEWFLRFRIDGKKLEIDPKSGLPFGWKKRKFTDVIKLNPLTKTKKGVEHPFIPMSALSETNMVITDVEKRIPKGGAKFRNLDTLLARITPCLENGKTGFVQCLKDDEVATGSTEFIVMRATEVISPYYIYLLARTDGFREIAIQSMSGSDGRQRVKVKVFEKILLNIPTKEILYKYHSNMKSIFDEIQVLINKNQLLKEARDILLPRLMTGMIDTDDMDIAV